MLWEGRFDVGRMFYVQYCFCVRVKKQQYSKRTVVCQVCAEKNNKAIEIFISRRSLCNFPPRRNLLFRNLSCFLTEVAPQCLPIHPLPIPLSNAGANPLWGGKNNEHWGGGTVLWSSHNVGLQLKHCGIDASLSCGWMSADKRVKASTFQPWELLKGAMMAAFLVSRLLERTD